MYETITQRQRNEKQTALLWLYLASEGLLESFTEFCRSRRDLSLAEVERELREITNQPNN